MSTTMANFCRFSSRLSSVHAFVSTNSRTNRRHFTKCFTFHIVSIKSRKRSRPFYDCQHKPSKHQQRHAFHINQDHQRTISRLYSSSSSIPTKSESDNSTPLSTRQKILDRFETDVLSSKGDTDNSADLIQAQRNALVDTLDWLEHVVIGYNLCPFAEAPMLREELTIQVVMGTNQTEILAQVLGESLRLRNRPGTSLVVCPDLCPNNFLAFLEVYNILVEGVLPDQELQDDLQIAPFHPLFVFGDDDDDEEDDEDQLAANNMDSIGHYTNRSPYPTFHVLREAEVEKAVDALDGNAETVWKRNVDFLEAMEDLFDAPVETDDDESASSSELLRSVFLKGKVHQTTNSKSCPFAKQTETIQSYHQQIRQLLRNFRKKDYWKTHLWNCKTAKFNYSSNWISSQNTRLLRKSWFRHHSNRLHCLPPPTWKRVGVSFGFRHWRSCPSTEKWMFRRFGAG